MLTLTDSLRKSQRIGLTNLYPWIATTEGRQSFWSRVRHTTFIHGSPTGEGREWQIMTAFTLALWNSPRIGLSDLYSLITHSRRKGIVQTSTTSDLFIVLLHGELLVNDTRYSWFDDTTDMLTSAESLMVVVKDWSCISGSPTSEGRQSFIDHVRPIRCISWGWVSGRCSWTEVPGRGACTRTESSTTTPASTTYSSGTWDRRQTSSFTTSHQ